MEKKLKQVIALVSNGKIEADDIGTNTILTDDFGFDSIQIIQMIVELENAFGIEFDDDELDIDNLTVYNNLKEIIEKKMGIN